MLPGVVSVARGRGRGQMIWSGVPGRGRGRASVSVDPTVGDSRPPPAPDPTVNWSAVRESLPQSQTLAVPERQLEMSDSEKAMYGRLNLILQEKGTTFCVEMGKFLEKVDNPWYTVLCWAVLSADFRTGKLRSFTGTLIVEFEKWVLVRKLVAPSQAVQDQVFFSFSQYKNASVMKSYFRVFRLTADRYKGEVTKIAHMGNYKEACDCAVALRLFDQFSNDVFVKALVLMDKINPAEEYLKHSPRAAGELVRYLDTIAQPDRNIDLVSDLCKQFPLVARQECAKLRGKTLDRLIKRLAELFNIGEEAYSGLATRMAKADLRHWVHHRYTDQELDMGLDNWRDLIAKKVKDSEDLQEELVSLLVKYDEEEARSWARQFNTKLTTFTSVVVDENSVEEDWENDDNGKIEKTENTEWRGFNTEQSTSNVSDTINSSWSADPDPDKFHQLALDNVIFVDSVKKFETFLDSLKGVTEVGLDVESSPNHVSPSASLLQIASRTAVHLLDMELLPSLLSDSHWSRLRSNLFANPDIKLLGYGVSGDIKLLAKTVVQLSDLVYVTKAVINLEELKPKLALLLKLPFSSDKKGLSGFTEMVLGKPLLKTNQISDWSKRPLRHSQIIYAALDAYVSVEIFLKLSEIAEDQEQKENYDKIVKSLSAGKKEKKEKKGKVTEKEEKDQALAKVTKPVLPKDFVPLNKEAICPGDLKVVCDDMLQGLCKKLRLCGVDALALENGQDHMDCVALAGDNRYVLSKGSVAARIAKELPKQRVMALVMDTLDDQIEEVFRYFNVVATEEDVFSRCVICNGGRYLVLPRSVMLQLADLKEKSSSRSGYCSHYTVDNVDDEDDEDYNFQDFADDGDDRLFDDPVASRWVSVEGGRVNVLTGETHSGVMVGVDVVQRTTLEKEEEFWVCDTCGKVYWQGSHWARAQDRIREVLSVSQA